MMSELFTSIMLETLTLTSQQGKPGTHFKKTSRKTISCSYGIGVQPTLSVFAMQMDIQHKIPVQPSVSHDDLNQEEVTASVHHKPQVCAVDDPHEQSNCAVSDHLLRCNPQTYAVSDHVLPESKTEKVKEPPEPTQQQPVVKASQEAGFPKTMNVGQVFRTRAVWDVHRSGSLRSRGSWSLVH